MSSAIVHVRQPNDYTCVQACAAMVLGVGIGFVLERLKASKSGTRHRALIALLKDHGLRCGDRFVSARGKALPTTAIVRITWPTPKPKGHVVVKVGSTWHDPLFASPFSGEPPAITREWSQGGRITSFLWIGDGMP